MELRTGEVFFSDKGEVFSVPETISVFGFTISFYGVFLALAALAGVFYIVKEAKKQRMDVEQSLTQVTIAVLAAVFCSRVFYVMFQWYLFVEEPWELLDFRSGGFSYFGALFGAWFAVKRYCTKKKLDFFASADILSVGAAVAGVFVWCGCALIREPLGRFYDGLFSMKISVKYLPDHLKSEYSEKLLSNLRSYNGGVYVSVHPVAVYGMVLSAVVCICLLCMKRFTKKSGEVFFYYLLLNAAVSLCLEFFRADRSCIWGTDIPVNCVVAGVLAITLLTGRARIKLSERKQRRTTIV